MKMFSAKSMTDVDRRKIVNDAFVRVWKIHHAWWKVGKIQSAPMIYQLEQEVAECCQVLSAHEISVVESIFGVKLRVGPLPLLLPLTDRSTAPRPL
jgi:hypothetical protein